MSASVLQVINLLFSDIFLLLTCISMPLGATTPEMPEMLRLDIIL